MVYLVLDFDVQCSYFTPTLEGREERGWVFMTPPRIFYQNLGITFIIGLMTDEREDISLEFVIVRFITYYSRDVSFVLGHCIGLVIVLMVVKGFVLEVFVPVENRVTIKYVNNLCKLDTYTIL